MQVLQPDDYAQILPLFAGLDNGVYIRSAAAGHSRAAVWVDDPRRPQTAMVWNRLDSLFLAGSTADAGQRQAVRHVLEEVIVPGARAQHIPMLEVFWDGSQWEAALVSELLVGLPCQPVLFNSYRIDEQAAQAAQQQRAAIPSFGVQAIDADLLANWQMAHIETLRGWIESFWPSQADFLQHGFGYAALIQGANGEPSLASLCISVYAADPEYELGLATVEAYQRRGLATCLADTCVAHCLARGWTPVWHCFAQNAASAAVAKKVGFEKVLTYPIYRCSLDSSDATIG